MGLVFIKTHNSNVDTSDFVEELEANDIWYKYGDTGIYVKEKDLNEAEEILYRKEMSNL